MKYIVIEFQSNADGTCGITTNNYESLNQAESRYHEILRAAPISNVQKHGAYLLTDDGVYVKSEYFMH